jgi:hypothetical protein
MLQLDGRGPMRLHAAGNRFQALQRQPGPHTLANQQRRRETHAVQAIVDRHAHSIDAQTAFQQMRQQRQSQVAVGDRGFVGRIAQRALRVGVDPLLVATGIGETLDAGLIHQQPIAAGHFPPYPSRQRFQIFEYPHQLVPLT